MRLGLIPAAVLALAIGNPALDARAQSASFVGAWQWSKEESSNVAGEPLPRSIELTIKSANPQSVQWTLTTVDANGGQHVESFAGTGNGKPVAVTGGEGTTAAFTVTANAMTSSYTNPDGSSDRASCALSADGKKMTCQGTEADGKGHSLNYTDVYHRK
jgi:hypothetical protein